MSLLTIDKTTSEDSVNFIHPRHLSSLQADPILAFRGLGIKDTTYATHGYHRYPAKFIPQLASKLIREYSKEGDIVADVFSGCGTTLVESKIQGRLSFGVDINPVADLLARVKTRAFLPSRIEREFDDLQDKISNNKIANGFNFNERIAYWFGQEEKRKLEILLESIKLINDKEIQRFFYCAFSNILKNCSVWLQKSIKPTRDYDKIPKDPYSEFVRQVKKMLRGNKEFYKILKINNHLGVSSKVYCRDARATKIKSELIDCIVTSPPYVTSYEYADVHQLTALWLEHTTDLTDFRKRFIGSAYKKDSDLDFASDVAHDIYKLLHQKDRKQAESVAVYFTDMRKVFAEMRRILKPRGKTCIVIGNTKLKGIEILNAEVFMQQLQSNGFKISDIAKREIPSKNLPSIRNKETGRFAKAGEKNTVTAYPSEYIIVAEK